MSTMGSWEAGAAVAFVLIGVAFISLIITVWYRRRLAREQAAASDSAAFHSADEPYKSKYPLPSPRPPSSRRAQSRAKQGDGAGEEGLSLLAHATHAVRTPYDPLPPIPSIPLVPNRLSVAEQVDDLEAQLPAPESPGRDSIYQSFLPQIEASWTPANRDFVGDVPPPPSTRRPTVLARLRNLRVAIRPPQVPRSAPAVITDRPHTAVSRKETITSPTGRSAETTSSFSAAHQILHIARDELSFPTFPSPASESTHSSSHSSLHPRNSELVAAPPALVIAPLLSASGAAPSSPVAHLRSVSVFHPSAQTRSARVASCKADSDSPASSVTVEHHRPFPSYPSVDLTSYVSPTSRAVQAEA